MAGSAATAARNAAVACSGVSSTAGSAMPTTSTVATCRPRRTASLRMASAGLGCLAQDIGREVEGRRCEDATPHVAEPGPVGVEIMLLDELHRQVDGGEDRHCGGALVEPLHGGPLVLLGQRRDVAVGGGVTE